MGETIWWGDIPNNAKYIVNTANSVNKNDKKTVNVD